MKLKFCTDVFEHLKIRFNFWFTRYAGCNVV